MALDDEVKELRKDLREILVAIARLDEQMKALGSIAVQVQATEVTVARMERDLKTVFTRYDALKSEFETLGRSIEEDKKGKREDRKWLLGAVVGVAALLVSVIPLFKGG